MDIRKAISEVMVKVHGKGLAAMDMLELKPDGKDEFKPVASYHLQFDSQQNQLEPIYYWILDFMAQVGWGGAEKTIDNFMASPGSGQFGEISMKATRMQEEGMKILGGMNQIIKSVLNLIYDLKEFDMRLKHYDNYHSDDKEEKEAGQLALKQIWLDNVDIKRGRGAIHSMASAEMGFSTLREAFMIVNSREDIDRINEEDEKKGGAGLINDSIKRILIPRLEEYLTWVKYSESELRKRYKIEINYLKSQVESVKLYSRWMKPYIEGAEKLRQQGFEKDAALVNAFSTTMFELQLFKAKDVGAPRTGEKMSGVIPYNLRRGYKQVVIITMKYRGHVSQRVTQKGDFGFGMGGVVDIFFDAYALNEEELAAANKLLEKEELKDSMAFSMDVAESSLKEMQEDLDYFLLSAEDKKKKDEEEKKESEKKSGSEEINPFSALLGLFKVKKKEKKKDEKGFVEVADIKKDNFYEKKMRAAAISGAAGALYLIYDIYKKAHRMASAPGAGFDTHDTGAVESLEEGGHVGFTDAFSSGEK